MGDGNSYFPVVKEMNVTWTRTYVFKWHPFDIDVAIKLPVAWFLSIFLNIILFISQLYFEPFE